MSHYLCVVTNFQSPYRRLFLLCFERFSMKKILVFAVLLLAGCASIVRDNTQVVPIQSNVENADIEITNSKGAIVYTGQTPTTVWLKPSSSGYFSPEKYVVKASKKGYSTSYTSIDWHISNWYWFGNFVFGGLVGWFIVDPLTGKMYYLDEVANIQISKLSEK